MSGAELIKVARVRGATDNKDMIATALFLCVMYGAPVVWTESSLIDVFPDRMPSPRAKAEIRLYAARGEQESFQICIRPLSKSLENIVVHATPLDEDIDVPTIRRVGYLQIGQSSPRAFCRVGEVPDPLLPAVPFTVASDTTASLWVTYHVPSTAKAGIKSGVLTVAAGSSRKWDIKVTLEVFDFEIPQRPSLKTRIVLHRDVLRSLYGIQGDDLEAWRPFYDSFQYTRLAPAIVQLDPSFGRSEPDRLLTSKTENIREHLGYLLNALSPSAIELSDVSSGCAAIPQPHDPLQQDPLQSYLHEMGNWLAERRFLDSAYVIGGALPERPKWQTLRDAYFRAGRADPRIKRLYIGPPHPFFERYAEIWAMPLRAYHPIAWQRLREGISLSAELPFPAEQVSASSCGVFEEVGGYETLPQDAYDGCLFTGWISGRVPEPNHPEWLQVSFTEPIQTDRFVIGWVPGRDADLLKVRTSVDGSLFGDASVSWRHYRPLGPYDASYSEGTFKMVKTFRAIRFELQQAAHDVPVGITELEFGVAPDPATLARIKPTETWLEIVPGDFPSLAVDAHPIEARVVPWVCFGHGATGVVLGSANSCPKEWRKPVDSPPLVWRDAATGDGFLFYPGKGSLLSSIRCERLRDGMEDYEYLCLIPRDKQGKTRPDFRPVYPRSGNVVMQTTPQVHDWVASPRTFAYDQRVETLDQLAKEIETVRIGIGRALAKIRAKKSEETFNR
ncbi:MAG TPA: DUF6067 family protein [Candidatus Hydrogenedentes bacterium]|nr:DUF6067 family protein [Candidatus Hydrogenedentota bacterium]